MRVLRYFVIALFFLSVVFSGIILQLKIAADSSIFNLSFYESFMEKHHLYQISQNYVLLKTRPNNCQEFSEPVCKSLAMAIESSFSTSWTRYQATGVLGNYLNYLTHKSDQLEYSLDLRSRKVILEQEVIARLQSYPEELLFFYGVHPALIEQLAQELCDLSHLPDTVMLSDSCYLKNPFISQLTGTVRTYYPYFEYTPYLFFGLFLVFMMIMTGTVRGLQLSGVALTLSGVLLVLLLSAGSDYIDTMIIDNLSRRNDLLASLGTNPIVLTTLFKNSMLSLTIRVGVLFALCGAFIAVTGTVLEKKLFKKGKAAIHSID